MWTKFVVLALFLIFFSFCDALSPKDLKIAVRHPQIQKQLNFIENFWKKAQKVSQNGVGDMSFTCAFCGIAINELEGYIAENLTISEMQDIIEKDICSNLGGFLRTACDLFVTQIPLIVSSFENRWSVSVVCVDLGFCTRPFEDYVDPQVIPTYTINLDLDPKLRWKEVCSNPQFKSLGQFLYKVATSLLAYNGQDINDIGEAINAVITPEYAQEIRGCAEAMEIPYGWVTIFNLGYEVSDACTSIVAQTNDGKILHARNLDFWAGMGFTDSLKNMSFIGNFQKGGKTVFIGTTFAGYVGILSGMRPGAFSITIDTRFYPDGISELFYEVVAAILEKNATLVSFLSRTVLAQQPNFDAALWNLSNDELIADVYYIIAGTKNNEGAVISRNRENATDVWLLDTPNRWFEVETNYDHWNPPPWFDNRRDPANNAMNAMGRNNLTLDGMYQVLSTKPVFNLQTTYSFLACPADGTYKTFARYCKYPCVE